MNRPPNNQMQLTSGGPDLEEARTVPRVACAHLHLDAARS